MKFLYCAVLVTLSLFLYSDDSKVYKVIKKNGRVITGSYVGFEDNRITIEMKDGKIVEIKKEDIKKVFGENGGKIQIDTLFTLKEEPKEIVTQTPKINDSTEMVTFNLHITEKALIIMLYGNCAGEKYSDGSPKTFNTTIGPVYLEVMSEKIFIKDIYYIVSGRVWINNEYSGTVTVSVPKIRENGLRVALRSVCPIENTNDGRHGDEVVEFGNFPIRSGGTFTIDKKFFGSNGLPYAMWDD